MFGFILISISTVMHVYVFWRASSVPLVKKHIPLKGLIGTGIVLWIILLLARIFGHHETGFVAWILEFLGMNWMASLFLIFISIFAVDIITGFGFLLKRAAPGIRGAALAVGIMLSAIALVQGLRPPVIRNYEVSMKALPEDLDGTRAVAVSDLHIGSMLGEDWLEERIKQIMEQKPDIIFLLGDIFEGHGRPRTSLLALLNGLRAPLGVWGVNGNHESNMGKDISIYISQETGIHMLRNQWTEVRKGLVLSGVEDPTSFRRLKKTGDYISKALTGRPEGAVILMSHSPLQASKAADARVDLMLSGHTHGGQIWPFNYLVARIHKHTEGLYTVKGMPLIVTRGTGTWGPRMRLWCPGEILRIKLLKKRK